LVLLADAALVLLFLCLREFEQDGVRGSEDANTLFVSLVYCAESTVRWFVVREKYC
jgi:hypothetical protein